MQETGSIDGVSEVFRYTFKDDGLTTMTAEQRKAFVKNLLEKNGVENLDELLKINNILADAESIQGVTKNAEKLKALAKDTPCDATLQALTDEAIQGTILERKASILEHVDLKKKSMKDLAANADYETKSIYNAIKKAIRNTNLKAAAKWGAIGAGVLGAVGLGVGAMNKKS